MQLANGNGYSFTLDAQNNATYAYHFNGAGFVIALGAGVYAANDSNFIERNVA